MSPNAIIKAAREAHARHWQACDTQEEGNKRTTKVVTDWQGAVRSASVHTEVQVAGLDAAIDVFDSATGTAYELKVSGKNPGHEFYKDVLKALAFNRSKPPPATAVSRLVFITEESGVTALRGGLGNFTCGIAKEVFGFEIDLVGL